MKKITICIQDNSLIFKYRTNKPVSTNLLNTNVISDNELVFSDEYLVKNQSIVGLFINDLLKEKNIKNIILTNNDIANLVLDIVSDIDLIESIYIKDNDKLTFSVYEKICKLKNLKLVNCYAIPTFMIELLDKKGIHVEARDEVLFTSRFMQENELTSFSKIYYKKSVTFGDFYNKEDLEDFKTFCTINNYLRCIYLSKYSLDLIKAILAILKECNEKKVLIQIHDDLTEENDVLFLRNTNKELKKDKIKIALIYSKDYLEKNYIHQVIFNTLKVCSLLIFAIVGSIFGYIIFNNYQSEKKVDSINEEIELLLNAPINENPSLNIAPEINIPIGDIPVEPEKKPAEDKYGYLKEMVNNYDRLLTLNDETVGWLTVNGTKINYPVVQTDNNEYYLDYNIKREKDYNGWVFMDYRNSIDTINDNTIIYAHNRYYSGVMFGTLNNVTKKKWYTNEENLHITFNTLYKNITWKVFSIYRIDVTSDYLYTNFSDKDRYQAFLDMLKNRSDVPLNTEVTNNDKILTLSTCLDNNKRLVVHAVMIKDETEDVQVENKPEEPTITPPSTPSNENNQKNEDESVQEQIPSNPTIEEPKHEENLSDTIVPDSDTSVPPVEDDSVLVEKDENNNPEINNDVNDDIITDNDEIQENDIHNET